MEGRRTVRKLNALILEEAATWFVDFSEGEVDPAAREEFNRWLRTSPEHVRAYLQIAGFWEDAQILDRGGQVDLDALTDRALGASNVVAFDVSERDLAERSAAGADSPTHSVSTETVSSMKRDEVRTRRLPRWAAAAAIAVVAVGVGVLAWTQGYLAPSYETDIGEQRSFTLADGSTVDLNSRSRLRVRYTERERLVELLEGQALFNVAKNAARPFVVRSGETRALAVGTRFDVYRKQGRTIVTVVEGRVAVSSAAKRAPDKRNDPMPPAQAASGSVSQPLAVETDSVLLTAGEQVMVSLDVVAPPRAVDVDATTAWTQKKLIFDSSPLADVVEEFNRYNRRQIVIDDAQLNDFHVSGVFPSTDSGRLVEFLKQRFAVAAREDDDEIHISRP